MACNGACPINKPCGTDCALKQKADIADVVRKRLAREGLISKGGLRAIRPIGVVQNASKPTGQLTEAPSKTEQRPPTTAEVVGQIFQSAATAATTVANTTARSNEAIAQMEADTRALEIMAEQRAAQQPVSRVAGTVATVPNFTTPGGYQITQKALTEPTGTPTWVYVVVGGILVAVLVYVVTRKRGR